MIISRVAQKLSFEQNIPIGTFLNKIKMVFDSKTGEVKEYDMKGNLLLVWNYYLDNPHVPYKR